MRCEIKVARSESVPIAVVRARVRPEALSQFVPAACGEVWSFIRSAGLGRPGRHVAVYLDGEGSVEVGAEVAEAFVGSDRVHCSQLPAGRVAATTHFGPYGGLGETHAAVRRWCAQHGHRPSSVCWEIYGHWEESWNADPAKIRTDVYHLMRD